MSTLTLSFDVPQKIKDGLDSGVYERLGGVVVKKDSKNIVGWLRENGNIDPSKIEPKLPLTNILSSANLVLSAINLGATCFYGSKNLQNTNKILDEIKKQTLK